MVWFMRTNKILTYRYTWLNFDASVIPPNAIITGVSLSLTNCNYSAIPVVWYCNFLVSPISFFLIWQNFWKGCNISGLPNYNSNFTMKISFCPGAQWQETTITYATQPNISSCTLLGTYPSQPSGTADDAKQTWDLPIASFQPLVNTSSISWSLVLWESVTDDNFANFRDRLLDGLFWFLFSTQI